MHAVELAILKLFVRTLEWYLRTHDYKGPSTLAGGLVVSMFIRLHKRLQQRTELLLKGTLQQWPRSGSTDTDSQNHLRSIALFSALWPYALILITSKALTGCTLAVRDMTITGRRSPTSESKLSLEKKSIVTDPRMTTRSGRTKKDTQSTDTNLPLLPDNSEATTLKP